MNRMIWPFSLKRLGVSPHEAARLRIVWSLRFLYQVGFVIAWTIITALFVEQFGIHNLLWFFLAEAVVMILGSLLARFITPRVNLQQYLLFTVLLPLVFLGMAFSVPSDHLAFFLFLVLAKNLAFYQLSLALYRKGEALFTPSEAQKMMPFAESAITVGAVVGAGITVWAMGIFEVEAVLGIWGGILFLMGAIIYFTPQWLHAIPEISSSLEHEASQSKSFGRIWKDLRKLPFLRYIIFVLVLQGMIFTVVEFTFINDVQHHITHKDIPAELPGPLNASLFGSAKEKVAEISHHTGKVLHDIVSGEVIMHEKLAHDLGMFHLLFGLLALFVQLFITPFVLHKFGIVRSMVGFFGILVVSLLGAALGYVNVNLLRTTQHGFHSLGESAYHVSFYSWFAHRRDSLRLFLDGIMRPLGVILGVLFLFLFPQPYWFIGALLLAVFLLVLGWRMRPSFTQISQKNMEPTDQPIAEQLNAIEVLGQPGHERGIEYLMVELQKGDIHHEVVRIKIIDTLTEVQNPEVVHAYLNILQDVNESREIKGRVLRSLYHLGKLDEYWEKHSFGRCHLLQVMEELFEQTHADAYLQKWLVMNIFTHMDSHQVVPFFLKIMEEGDRELQSICLRSCMMFDDPEIVHYLYPYLQDDDPRIKGHALIAMWRFADKKALRDIVRRMIYQPEEEAQIAAIYAIGETRDYDSRSLLPSFLHSPRKSTQLHALVALTKLGESQYAEHLVHFILTEEYRIAQTAYRMLERLPTDVQERIQERIHAAVSHRVMEIIVPHRIEQLEDLRSLPRSVLDELKRLYGLTRKYDSLFVLERV